MQAGDADYQECARALETGLREIDVALDREQRARLVAYVALLETWNRAFNLTAVRDPLAMIQRHLLDSLTIAPWVDAGPVLDVGTGAGLPGIPLAIARPAQSFTLIDSNRKKTRFVQQAAGELGLDNVEVVTARVERLDRPAGYARITSRAFSSLATMVLGTRRLLAKRGAWLAMKGKVTADELAALPADVVSEVIPVGRGGGDASGHLVRIVSRSGS